MAGILKQAEQYAYRLSSEDGPSTDLYLHPDELSQYFNPANEITQEKLDRIRPTIHQGVRVPVQVNTDGVYARLDDGHHRVAAAKEAGLDRVPVSVLRVDKHFFKGKQTRFAPPIVGKLKSWMGA